MSDLIYAGSDSLIPDPVAPFEPGLDALSTGQGHLEITFSKADEKEVQRAKDIIQDMMKRGYLIFIDEGDGKLKRVKRFDPEHEKYIIDDPQPEHKPEEPESSTGKKRRGRKPYKKSVDMRRTRATSVPPTAGG